MHVLL
jgi:hypothetical protein